MKKEAACSSIYDFFSDKLQMKTIEKFGSVLMAKGVTCKCSIIIKLTHILDIVLLSLSAAFTICDCLIQHYCHRSSVFHP